MHFQTSAHSVAHATVSSFPRGGVLFTADAAVIWFIIGPVERERGKRFGDSMSH